MISEPKGLHAEDLRRRESRRPLRRHHFLVPSIRNFPLGVRRNPPALVKLAELKLLGKGANPYCYNYPVGVQIETTSRCNLTCPMCPTHKVGSEVKTKKTDMPTSDFKAILEDWSKRIFTLHLFGRGEPLLAKNIFELIDYSNQLGIPHVSITTNGVLLDQKRAQELNRVGLSELRVSIDGADQSTYEKIRGTDLEQVLENIAFLRSISDIPVSVNFLLTRQTWDSALKMPEVLERIGAHCLRLFPVVTYDESMADGIYLDQEQQGKYAKLIGQVQRECKQRGKFFIGHNPVVRECILPFLLAYIDVEGNLTPCCRIEDHPLCNVLEVGFFEAWNCKKMCSWRKALLLRRFPKKCIELNCLREW